MSGIVSMAPYIVVRGGEAAIAFYTAAFGATELFRMTDPSDGRIGHAELTGRVSRLWRGWTGHDWRYGGDLASGYDIGGR